jgi:hypothetical protein
VLEGHLSEVVRGADCLGGTCSSQNGPVVLSGKIEGAKIRWTIKSESQGGPESAVEFGTDRQFTGKRSK